MSNPSLFREFFPSGFRLCESVTAPASEDRLLACLGGGLPARRIPLYIDRLEGSVPGSARVSRVSGEHRLLACRSRQLAETGERCHFVIARDKMCRQPQASSLRFRLRHRATFVAGAELNTLRQRQLAREIDGVGLAPHVLLPAIASALAAAAGFFFAAECAADFGATRSRVHIGDSTIASDRADKFFCFAHIVSEDRLKSILAGHRFGSRSLHQSRDTSSNTAAGRTFHDEQSQNQASRLRGMASCNSRLRISRRRVVRRRTRTSPPSSFNRSNGLQHSVNSALVDHRSHQRFLDRADCRSADSCRRPKVFPHFIRDRFVHDHAAG